MAIPFVYVAGTILSTTIAGVYFASKYIRDTRNNRSLQEAAQSNPSENKSDSIERQDESFENPNIPATSQTSGIEDPMPGRSIKKLVLQGFDEFAAGGCDISDDDSIEEICTPIALLQERGGKLQLDIEALRNLLNPAVLQDLPVAVISIAGAFRMGKSFLLNLLLRYFEKRGWKDSIKGKWLRDWNSTQQEGIDWRGGSEGHTRGIVAWGKPIIVQRTDGTRIAVILLDTQGNFEHGRKRAENVGVFALSTLFSSLQIFNISQQIQTNDLEYLQDLVFLVRDWHSPKDYQYGHIGGNKYLSNIMSRSGEENEAGVHRYLNSAFTKLSCFLMPEPESKVRILEGDAQILQSSDLGKNFFDKVTDFALKYFHPDRIPTKSIGFFEEVTAKHLLDYMEKCAEGVLDGSLPDFPTMMQKLEEMEEPTWEAFDDDFAKEKKRAVQLFLQTTHYGSDANRDQQTNRLMGHFENTKATMEKEMNVKRVRYSRIVVDAWLEDSVTKLQNHRGYMYTKVEDLQSIKSDCLKTSFRKDPRDCSQVATILQQGEDKLEAACSDNVRDVKDRNSKVNGLAIGALVAGVVIGGPVAAGGFLLGEIAVGAGLASVTGVATAGGWLKWGLNNLWSDHQKKVKTD